MPLPAHALDRTPAQIAHQAARMARLQAKFNSPYCAVILKHEAEAKMQKVDRMSAANRRAVWAIGLRAVLAGYQPDVMTMLRDPAPPKRQHDRIARLGAARAARLGMHLCAQRFAKSAEDLGL